MIEEILPSTAVSVEAHEDAEETVLFPDEQRVVGRAVEKRKREFSTGRACAHAALERLGFAPTPIPSGERGEPLWPSGVVGSITHCDGYRAAALARDGDLLTIGIDAETHAALPDGLVGDIARPEELPMLAALSREDPSVHWDRLLFSAKESVYKAWFPLTKRWLGFEDATLSVDRETGSFSARLLERGATVNGTQLGGFDGRWLVRDGLILTAIAAPA